MQNRVAHVLVMIVAAAAVLAPLSAAQQPQPAQQPQQPQSWQYASFLRSDEAAWQAPDQSAVAPDVFGVYEKLGGKLPRDKVNNTEVLNLVGRDGWELVAVTHQPGPEMTYWFKRAGR